MTQTLGAPRASDATDTMRAAVVTEFGGPLQIEELDLPTPGHGEALVKLETSGVCHTDLHAAHGDWPVKPQPPFIPGHEGYGTVVALGDGVDDLKVGDKVGNAWLWSACGTCEYCRTGWETLCESQQNGGYSVNGSFGSYMLVNAAYAARIPDNVDPLEVAPILCAGVTVYKGLKVTDTRPGQWVAISGIGGLGHIAVQYARAMGLRVVAVDIDDSKLALATQLGAEVAVNAKTTDVVAEVQKATGGVHGVLVTAVHPQAFGQAIGLTRRGGTIVFNGLPPGDFPAPIFDIVLKGLTIRGSIVGTRQDMAEALDFYARGLIHPTVQSAGSGRHQRGVRQDGARADRRPHRHRLPLKQAQGPGPHRRPGPLRILTCDDGPPVCCSVGVRYAFGHAVSGQCRSPRSRQPQTPDRHPGHTGIRNPRGPKEGKRCAYVHAEGG